MTKRLFLFAGYNKNGIVDDSLVYYVRALAKHGDVVLCMDSTCSNSEIQKLTPFVLHCMAVRHGEYDFGSYKRTYLWARDNLKLNNYDFVYLVNDSVYGPLCNIAPTIKKIEDINTDAAGIVVATHKTHEYMESWFVRLNRAVFCASWFNDFMCTITTQPTKAQITIAYEHGLSNLIKRNNCSYDGMYKCRGRFTYNNPKKLFTRGCPFIKKASFIRHNGAAGVQIKYILSHCDKTAATAVMKSATGLYGEKYMNWFLTYNPLKIMIRNIRYWFKKLQDGGI